MNFKERILEIHKRGLKTILAITGGGAEAIGHLLKYGGGSNTILEAVVPYDHKSFEDFVHGKPDKYCSESAARDLAMAAFLRAMKLTGRNDVLGIGASCSLAKDGERAGREHHAFIAWQTISRTSTLSLQVPHEMNREQQEDFVAKMIIGVLANEVGVDWPLGCGDDCSIGTAVMVQPGIVGAKDVVTGVQKGIEQLA